jgi:BirA family biotin operon repressor/biotin-[acetyl-CoA-carboxylase] ligase
VAERPSLQWAKCAGILLERSEDAVVVGIGVNVAHHPKLADREVTSLAAAAGSAPDLEIIFGALIDSFARWLHRWRGEGVASIRSAWLAAAHPIGTALRTSLGEGLFGGLEEDGALRLRLADGTERVIHAGDVFLI